MTSSENHDLLEGYYHYIPNKGLIIAALVFYGLIAVWSAYEAIKTKYLLIYVVTLTAVVEFIGFIFRLICLSNATLGNYVTTALLLIMAPNLLALYNYIIVGRIIDAQTTNQTQEALEEQIEFHKEKKWTCTIPIIQDKTTGLYNASKISYFFLLSDIVAFALQGMAGGMMSNASSANTGTTLFQISLAVQLGFFVTFTYVTYQTYSLKYYKESPGINPDNQAILFRVLFSTIALLTVRNIYRLIEFSGGSDGYVSRTEAFFYTFDTTLIILCICLYSAYPAGNYFTSSTVSSGSAVKDVSSSDTSSTHSVGGKKKSYSGIGEAPGEFNELEEVV